MHGNVLEWCQDKSVAYPSKAVVDPVGSIGDRFCSRGGCWHFAARRCRSAESRSYTPDDFNIGLGFRVALSPVINK